MKEIEHDLKHVGRQQKCAETYLRFSVVKHDASDAAAIFLRCFGAWPAGVVLGKCRYLRAETACNARYVLVFLGLPMHFYPLKQASKRVVQSAPRNKPSLLYTKDSRKPY